MKVSIIGGGGLVGSSAAFALQCGGIVSQIDLIDLNADRKGFPGTGGQLDRAVQQYRLPDRG